MKPHVFLLGIFVFLLWGGAKFSPLLAQCIWNFPAFESGISIEVNKPYFSTTDRFSTSSVGVFTTIKKQVNDHLFLLGEIPFAHAGYASSGSATKNNQTTLGNPYLGLEMKSATSSFLGEVGVRIPLASEEKGFVNQVGTFSDFDRWEAFIPQWLTVAALGNYLSFAGNANGVFARIRGGASVLFNTDKDPYEDSSELFVLYFLQTGYRAPDYDILVVFSGRYWATMDIEGATFGDKSFHQIGVSANIFAGKFRPGVLIRLPLDENLNDVLDAVIGIRLSYTFPRK